MIPLVFCQKFDCDANVLITHVDHIASGIGPGASESSNSWQIHLVAESVSVNRLEMYDLFI